MTCGGVRAGAGNKFGACGVETGDKFMVRGTETE